MQSLAPPPYAALEMDTFSTARETVPTYSPLADVSERVLYPSADSSLRVQPADTTKFEYKTDHMGISLGPKIWTARAPAYGLHGVVQGTVKFFGLRKHVDKVTVTIEGHVTSSTTERGMLMHQTKLPLLVQKVALYSSYTPNERPWDAEHLFSIQIPKVVKIDGKAIQLPPSYYRILPGTTAEISYTLKFDMIRKGLQRHETKEVSILYLPKSHPSHPPLAEIPLPSRDHPFVLSPDDGVKLVDISEAVHIGLGAGGSEIKRSVTLALPSPASVASGETLPLALSVIKTSASISTDSLVSSVCVHAVKQTRMWRKAGREISVRNAVIGVLGHWHVSRTSAEASLFCGSLPAGCAGRENSWSLAHFVEVKYFVRVILRLPDKGIRVLHEEPVTIATDLWGTSARELASTGGIPMPALGIAQ